MPLTQHGKRKKLELLRCITSRFGSTCKAAIPRLSLTLRLKVFLPGLGLLRAIYKVFFYFLHDPAHSRKRTREPGFEPIFPL